MTALTRAPDALFLAFQEALAGRYSIDRELGRGGMGVVYLAREVHLDRLVAIKLLPPMLAERPALRDRFLREAQLAAKLSHPNVIPIHAVEQCGGFVFFVMAYVDGETVAQRVHHRGPMSATDGIRMLRDVAWALSHAHAQGLVHRDVKPDNILIEHATGRALVADFGIAAATSDLLADNRERDDHAPSTGTLICGTPEFMSPEQALGETVDARSDLYSLGATAFYALSGRLPFDGTNSTQLLARQITEPAPTLASTGVPVPRKLGQLIDQCLAKDPSQRPATAQAFAELLGLVIEQRRELPATLRDFVKRSGRMDGGGTMLSLSAAVVAAVATFKVVGATSALVTLTVSLTAVAVGFGIVAAKRLLDHGFTQADVVPAFRAELQSSREERGVVPGHLRVQLERIARKGTAVSASTSAALVVIAVLSRNASWIGEAQQLSVGLLAAITCALALLSGFSLLALVQLRRDVDVEFWSAAWCGRFGAWAFSIARKWRGTKPLTPAMTHRATELSLGMATEQLFASLPKATQQSLRELPSVLQRLQRDAHALRARLNLLQDGLGQASHSDCSATFLDDFSAESIFPVAGKSAVGKSAEGRFADVRVERDLVQSRLRDTVGAMETMRLSLLRLHAGSLSLDAFTTHLDGAAALSEEVERLIAAQNEVEACLRIAAPLELTPV